jgi:hypothetical protein
MSAPDLSTAAPPPARPAVPVAALLAAAARRAGAGYLVALVLAFAQSVLAIGLTDDLPVAAIGTLPVLLVSLALLGSGTIHSSDEVAHYVDPSLGVSVRLTPLTLLLAVLVGVLVVAVLERRAGRLPAVTGTLPRDRWVTAAFTGGVLAAVASALAALLPVRVPDQYLLIDAVGLPLALGAFLVGGCASLLGDAVGRRGTVDLGRLGWQVRPTGETRAALAAVGTLLGGTAVVLLVVATVWAAVASPGSLLGVPALVLNVLVWLVALVTGGGISAAWATVEDGAGSTTLLGLGLPLWASAALLLLALVATLAAGVVLAVRRPRASWRRAWIMPLVFALVGALLTLLSGVVLSGGLSLAAFDRPPNGWIGITPWWCVSLAVWAVGIEALARYVAPFLIGLLPAGAQDALRRRAIVPPEVAAPIAPAPIVPASIAPAAAHPVPAGPASPAAARPVPAGPASPAPQATGPTGPAPLPPAAPWWTRRGAVVGAAVLLLGTVAAVTVHQLEARVFGPGAVVADYLDALEAGDASAALRIAGPTPEIWDPALLTDEIYRAATDRPTDGRVVGVTRSGDRAEVTVEYRQGDQTVTDVLVATRTGSQALVFGRWEMSSAGSGHLSIVDAYAGNRLTVNGVDVELGDGIDQAALPGTYTMAGQTSRWQESTTVSATVLGTSLTTVDGPVTTPTAALQDEAERLVRDYLDVCLAATTLEPDDCPNDLGFTSPSVTGVRWTLEVAPEITLREWGMPGSYLVEPGMAESWATVTASYAWGDPAHAVGDPFTERVDLWMFGTIIVDGDDVRYEYD